MYGHTIAVAEAGLKVKLDRITSVVRSDDGKLLGYYSLRRIILMILEILKCSIIPYYTYNTEQKPCKRPCDIDKAGNERNKALSVINS